jgi:hypothetical protein
MVSKKKKSKTPAKSRTKAKPKAVSLHLGLNAVDPGHYAGWSGELAACEFDAKDMAAIAASKGMKSTVLLTEKGTRANTLKAIRAAAKSLKSGDFFFLTYSGHGGQVEDVTGMEDETDKLDETWCLYDAQLIDDELYYELSRFAPGVRILVFSDSCHSGSVVRARPGEATTAGRVKQMPPTTARNTYAQHKEFYDKLQKDVAKAAGKSRSADPDTVLANVAESERRIALVKNFKSAVILVSGCQDNQFSMDGDKNGAFTEQLLKTWANGKYKGNYAKFHAAIKGSMPPSQSPNLFMLGKAGSFALQQPFTV